MQSTTSGVQRSAAETGPAPAGEALSSRRPRSPHRASGRLTRPSSDDRGSLAYWRLLAVQPACLCVSAVAVLLAGRLAGPFAAGTVLVTIGCALAVLARFDFARRSLDRVREQRARKERAADRESRLARFDSPLRPDVQQLTALVHQIERAWPCESRALELEELLDHFVARAVVREEYRTALCAAPPSLLSTALSPGTTSPLRSDLFRRRTELRDEYERRAAALDDELDEISEFVRLVALRAARPEEEAPCQEDDELDRRLWHFDAQEAALKQLEVMRRLGPERQASDPHRRTV